MRKRIDWQTVISGYDPDQETVKEYCARVHVSSSAYYTKRKELRQSQILPVRIENQLPNLMYYLKDWRVGLDNNLAEREGIKPFVMARKNFLFSDTRSGARYTCMYFSLLISARMNHLNPEMYLSWMLKQLKNGIRNDGTIPDEVIQEVLPYADNLPDTIRISKNRSDF